MNGSRKELLPGVGFRAGSSKPRALDWSRPPHVMPTKLRATILHGLKALVSGSD